MKIATISNNPSFYSKINYNKSVKSGFAIARTYTESNSNDDLEKTKNFIDNITAILKDKSKPKVTFQIKRKESLEHPYNYNKEGMKCIKKIQDYAHKLPKENSYLDILKSQYLGSLALVELLKENYSKMNCIQSTEELSNDLKNLYKEALLDKLNKLEKRLIRSK